MAFVNEWILQEDIEKYELVELCEKYSKDDSKFTAVKDPNSVRGIDWTIDKGKEIWLLSVASVTNPNYDLPSPTQERVFILHYKGVNVEVRLWGAGISTSIKEVPYKYSWKYLGMNPNSIDGVNDVVLKAIACEALQTYKEFGLRGRRTDITEITCINFD